LYVLFVVFRFKEDESDWLRECLCSILDPLVCGGRALGSNVVRDSRVVPFLSKSCTLRHIGTGMITRGSRKSCVVKNLRSTNLQLIKVVQVRCVSHTLMIIWLASSSRHRASSSLFDDDLESIVKTITLRDIKRKKKTINEA
jgi:hypothetical protein